MNIQGEIPIAEQPYRAAGPYPQHFLANIVRVRTHVKQEQAEVTDYTVEMGEAYKVLLGAVAYMKQRGEVDLDMQVEIGRLCKTLYEVEQAITGDTDQAMQLYWDFDAVGDHNSAQQVE